MAQKPKPPSLSSRLAAAKELGMVLGQESDVLNAKLAIVETEIINLQLGVGEAVDLPVGFEPWKLAFRKLGDEWGLCVIAEGKSPIPIENASRPFRLAAVDTLKALIDAVILKADEQIKEVRSGIEKLDALIVELQPQGEEIPF